MPASWARTDVPPSIASHVDDFDMNTPDTKVLIQQYLAQSRQSRFVALMSSDAASTSSHGHHLPELDFSYSFSDPGHSSVARGSSSVSQSSSLSTRQPHNSIRAPGGYTPQTREFLSQAFAFFLSLPSIHSSGAFNHRGVVLTLSLSEFDGVAWDTWNQSRVGGKAHNRKFPAEAVCEENPSTSAQQAFAQSF